LKWPKSVEQLRVEQSQFEQFTPTPQKIKEWAKKKSICIFSILKLFIFDLLGTYGSYNLKQCWLTQITLFAIAKIEFVYCLRILFYLLLLINSGSGIHSLAFWVHLLVCE
jgi:hypothetical protein